MTKGDVGNLFFPFFNNLVVEVEILLMNSWWSCCGCQRLTINRNEKKEDE